MLARTVLALDPARRPSVALGPDATGSAAMAEVLRTARRVAGSDSSLLIRGETGTGKEWLARAIHASSRRAEETFVAVNCAALSETLLESELFGHERGAFTGAERARRGHFEMAHRGTLFLDEIGDTTPALQAKLLRAVEERKVQRLGSEQPTTVDVRMIAATHRDLAGAIRARAFRADLYYRLAVVELELPPLRERREDIAWLARQFVAHHRLRLSRHEVTALSAAALERLHRHDWPGNVRELANVLERAVLLADGPDIEPGDLPRSISGDGGVRADTFAESLFEGPLAEGRRALVDAFEREYLGRLLAEHGGRVGQVARRAGIDVRTVREKLKLFDLDRRRYLVG